MDTNGEYVCPPCQIFYPTHEEFKDPLRYIASIRAQAVATGICKIVPPEGWRPPFAVNEAKFKFRTRIQPLNCLEGNSREEGLFMEGLRMFLYRQGKPMQEMPKINGTMANLSLLYHVVEENGGFDAIETGNSWISVASELSCADQSLGFPTEPMAQEVREIYAKYLLEYEKRKVDSAVKAAERELDEAFLDSDSSPEPEAKRQRGGPKKYEKVPPPPPPAEPMSPPPSQETMDVEASPPQIPGMRKRPRGGVKRVLISETPESCDPSLLEPQALSADPNRQIVMEPPIVRVGQRFYRSFPGVENVSLGQVVKVNGGKKPSVVVEYNDGVKETMSYSTMQMVLANGASREDARRSLESEVCQICYRADCVDRMAVCESCDSGYHIFCLTPSLNNVPTGDWYCASCIEDQDELETKKQASSEMKFGFETGPEYSLVTYKAMADGWKRNYFQGKEPSVAELEKEYWKVLKCPTKKIQVEYGSDVDTGAMGSGFPTLEKLKKIRQRLHDRLNAVNDKNSVATSAEYSLRKLLAEGLDGDFEAKLEEYATNPWNLTNLPKLNGSLLQYLDEDIKGVMVPWMYVGMCFSTFCWHAEDHNFYSISYLHRGAPKTWYGVPGHYATKMEQVMRHLTPRLFDTQPDLHLQLVTMFSPETLQKHGIPVYRATHYPNEFIVTYPSSYHSGFNNGFNLAEAVNFATADWIDWGHIAVLNYKKFSKIPVFSHDALLLTMTLAIMESSDALDIEGIKSHLLPALSTLRDETLAFWEAVKRKGITKTEHLETYLESQGRADFLRGTSRQQRMAAPVQDELSRPMKMMRTSKMDFGSNSRVSRQVLWAGRAGRHDGLRCWKCQQYCYVAAVACLKCRIFGCKDHFDGMCKCDLLVHGCWLHHIDYKVLAQYIDTLRRKVEAVTAWEEKLKSVSSLEDFEEVLEIGESLTRQQIGPSKSSLKNAKSQLVSMQRWMLHANDALKYNDTDAIERLFKEVDSFPIKLAQIERMKAAVLTKSDKPSKGKVVFDEIDRMIELQRHSDDMSWEELQFELVNLQELVVRLEKLENEVSAMEKFRWQSDLTSLRWLVNANELLTKSLMNAGKKLEETIELYPTGADIDALLQSTTRPPSSSKWWKIKKLMQLRQMCAEQSQQIQSFAMERDWQSVEALEKELVKLVQLPAFCMEAVDLFSCWKQAKTWTYQVTVALRDGDRMKWSQAQTFLAQANQIGIPHSLSLRDQLQTRIQDTERWLGRLRFVFKVDNTPSKFSLQAVLDRNAEYDEKFTLICICRQVYKANVDVVRCLSCFQRFHLSCIGMDESAKNSRYLCESCCQRKQVAYKLTPPSFPLYCVCRQPYDDVPMICCDFCDEWYHAKCIKMATGVMSKLEAYRCKACALRQGLRPPIARATFDQLQGLIARGEALQIETSELHELKTLAHWGHAILHDVAMLEQTFLHKSVDSLSSGSTDVLNRCIEQVVVSLNRFETLVLLEEARAKIKVMQWFVRAIHLLFHTKPAPRFSQLLILLTDVKQENMVFTTPALQNFYEGIEKNCNRAVSWIQKVKNIDTASHTNLSELLTEAEEISKRLILPEATMAHFQMTMNTNPADP